MAAINYRYFGNLGEATLAPGTKPVAETSFDELTCTGFDPKTKVLEAMIEVKLPRGYNGDLCHLASTEYVRFFLDCGSGREDAGLAGVSVPDIPNGTDCFADRIGHETARRRPASRLQLRSFGGTQP